MQSPHVKPAASPPAPNVKRSALVPAIVALLLPLAAFAVSWLYAGKIPMAVPKAEWGTWFFIGVLMGVAGIVGLVLAVKALLRGGYRSLAVAALVLNLAVVLIAWAGLFA